MAGQPRRYALRQGVMTAILLILLHQSHAGADAWEALQHRLVSTLPAGTAERSSRPDPWVRLRAIYLPFSKMLETDALTDPAAARKVSGRLHQALRAYDPIIREASSRFRVPSEIIGAVIMAESRGDPRAQAFGSTAKGLMQTIDGTFQDARESLLSQGIIIRDDPFDPRASIMAGVWYLDRMYTRAAKDGKQASPDRRDIASWRYPLEYYYAGPGNGRLAKPRLMVYSGGKRVLIDKPSYSRKVLRWAALMKPCG